MVRTAFVSILFAAALAVAPARAQETAAPAPKSVLTPPAAEPAPQPAPETAPKQGAREEAAPMGAPSPQMPPPQEKSVKKAPNGSLPAETTEDRYTFSRVQDGYVRLDNRTGQVTFCAKHAVGWACQLAPEDRAVLEKEIARLQEQNAALKREMLAHGLPLPRGVQPQPAARSVEPSLPFLSQSDVDRIKGFAETVWRRLVDLIISLQKDVFKKS